MLSNNEIVLKRRVSAGFELRENLILLRIHYRLNVIVNSRIYIKYSYCAVVLVCNEQILFIKKHISIAMHAKIRLHVGNRRGLSLRKLI